MVFIIGCQRSGTTYLQRLLGSHPKIKTGQESFVFEWYLAPLLRSWEQNEKKSLESGRAGVGLKSYFTNARFRELLLGFLAPMLENLKEGEMFLEKTPDHSMCIPEIIQLLPNAKIIHTLRDARDNVASLLAAGRTWGRTWAPHNVRHAAWWWVKYEKTIQRNKKLVPKDQFHEVRYETLRKSPIDVLERLRDFLGVAWSEEQIRDAVERNSPEKVESEGTKIIRTGELALISGEVVKEPAGFVRKANPGSWREDLSFAEKAQTWLIARKTMNKTGYPWKYPWS